MRSVKSNENIRKKEDGSYYVVSANKASSVTLQSPGNESQRKHTAILRISNRQSIQSLCQRTPITQNCSQMLGIGCDYILLLCRTTNNKVPYISHLRAEYPVFTTGDCCCVNELIYSIKQIILITMPP